MRMVMIMLFLLSGCGSNEQRVDKRTRAPENNKEIEILKKQVLALQGTIAQLDAFVANDFADCNNTLPPFEKKICKIAQTANAEQQIIFASQLQTISKIFQNQIYGPDCINDTDAGCPVTGSILSDISELEDQISTFGADIADLQTDISLIQDDITDLQSDLADINNRLNYFNGSGSSIETVVTRLQTSIASLESRVDAIENTLAGADVYKTVRICGNIAASGPVYEAALITGDNQKVVMFIDGGSGRRGLAVQAEAGVSGTQYLTTDLNSSACKFKIYDLTTSIKMCWNNTNRNATTGSIDTVCNSAGGFASPTAACTCAN